MSGISELSTVIDQLKRIAVGEQVGQIDRVVERYVSDSHYSLALAAAHIGAVFGEILDVSNWEDMAAWVAARRAAVIMIDRTDEVGFRINAPRDVDGITVVQVDHFKPGEVAGGEYARALVVTRRGDSDFCTHWLIYRDDRNDWMLWEGHYDIATLAEAQADARARASKI